MDKRIVNIENISGKLLLFGGVYSNYQALEQLMQVALENGIEPENCICTGDIVGYCAQPQETVALFRAWGAQSIAGNVELQLADGAEDCGCDFIQGGRCDGFSKLWYPFAKSRLSKESIDWMANLPDHLTFNYAGKHFTVVHGSYTNTSQFVFDSTPAKIKKLSFKTAKTDAIIAGHSGLPFYQKIEDFAWINPGVIGMPANDGTPKTWYVIMEEIKGRLTYSYKNLEYNHYKAHQLMIDENLPQEYADTLLSGIWDNMEILPHNEKQLQGIPYNFENTKEYSTINTLKD
ncbi:metallophosphoesterase family protein [Spongiimicrobium sp. 3-5]|uniref:metallophosphoesterase family protein n=1 Tax=Spongiimicrobium sp. 3-5 TaxID=3332596 RepID=UPI00397EADEE